MVDKTMSAGAVLERLFPRLALRRVKALIWLEQAKRVYDAAKATSYRTRPTDTRSADGVMEQAGSKVRQWARYLDENHDLAIGILDVLVNRIVGTGITVEPMVKNLDGTPAVRVNEDIRKLLDAWWRRPEVTGEYAYGEVQRLACRAWLRDGEMLVQHVRGPRFQHYTEVPYSLELVEADLLPFEAITGRDNVIHGVEKDGWGRPRAYWLYRRHPGNFALPSPAVSSRDLVRVPAENLTHLKFARRFRQTRGISVFHGVIRRLDDLKDYEESERIAARIAASLTAFIKKTEDFAGEAAAASGDRSFEMEAGMIFDRLAVGEDIGMVKSDRPNEKLDDFVAGQQRALAAGTGTSFSSIAKRYDGTYSAQRQELVESEPGYGKLQEYFIETFERRNHVERISAAVAGGVLRLPANVDLDTLFDAEMHPPGIPWIDPLKEVQADALKIETRLRARSQIIRDRGDDPHVVEEQIKAERERDEANGLAPVEPGAGDGAGGDGGDGGDGNGESDDGAGAGPAGGADADAA